MSEFLTNNCGGRQLSEHGYVYVEVAVSHTTSERLSRGRDETEAEQRREQSRESE